MQKAPPALIQDVTYIANSRETAKNLKWNIMKDEIHRIYITKGSTLSTLRRTMEEAHNFKAR